MWKFACYFAFQRTKKCLYEAKQKKVSASTNPTDRVLKRRPDTFFRLRVRYFLALLRAWPVASSIATAREKSKGKNQAKGLGKEILTVTQAFELRSRCVKRCATQYSIDATRFLSAAGNRASYSLLATSCFNFETDISVFFYFFGWFVLAQLISCFSSTARPMAASVKFPADKKPFLQRTSSARERGCHLTLGVAGCTWR